MKAELLYTVSGVAFFIMVSNCFFWIRFDWAGESSRLTTINAGIMSQAGAAAETCRRAEWEAGNEG